VVGICHVPLMMQNDGGAGAGCDVMASAVSSFMHGNGARRLERKAADDAPLLRVEIDQVPGAVGRSAGLGPGVAVDAEGADQAGRAVMDGIVEGARRWSRTAGARRSPMTN